MKLDPKLREFCTVRQLEIFEALEKHGTQRAAANALGCNKSLVNSAMMAVKKKAALQGYSPEHDMTRTVPDGMVLQGVSTYYNAEGKPSGQWVKSAADTDRQREIYQAAAAAMAEELPRARPLSVPAHVRADLATVYTLTDSHVGALAWHEEGGHDWDLKIAESTLVGCFERMLEAAPPSGIGVVAQLGDFLHQDGVQAITPTSGHLLDADGRFTKVVQVAVRVLRRVVDLALAKHGRVVVLLAEGNHDISSSIWLRTMFAALYENEPRIEVINSPLPYYAIQHGQTMLCWHHGHLKKNDQLPLLFASQFPHMWGSTTKRYAHCGHRHHAEEKEHSGMLVIQHPTLAARDAYAARGGWIAERQATAITYSAKYGQVERNTVTPEMV
jgi:DNA-binding transcriptional regulator YdaS (Cro superfamily)